MQGEPGEQEKCYFQMVQTFHTPLPRYRETPESMSMPDEYFHCLIKQQWLCVQSGWVVFSDLVFDVTECW